MEVPFEIDLSGKVVVITGGSGVLGSVIAKSLASVGANVAVIGRNKEKINKVVEEIKQEGGLASGYSADVLDKKALEEAHKQIVESQGKCDFLINGAGGNHPKATTSKEYLEEGDLTDPSIQSFFDLEEGAITELFNLNFLGTLLPTQVFSQDMIGRKGCNIINISSMNAYTPLTKIPAYSGAKAAISNFTEWLAVHFSKLGIRVNAISPGFFLTEQNRGLLVEENGDLSARANKILSQVPMERFGEPEELIGTIFWLIHEKSSSYVNGIVVPIDGGFLSYSGV
ncbi:SDR family oxidoreductase [Oceanobacillus sp. CAU 1775]